MGPRDDALSTLSHDPLDAVLRPVTEARGLPNAHYVDAATFEREREALFLRGWAGVGFASDVPEPGDVAPVDLCGQPLLLARGHDGALRVFLNVCRHRGMILVERPGKAARVIRCPYHSWCYDLDGGLRTTPHVGGPGHSRHEAIRREDLGLIGVRAHVWMGVVFVDLSGRAAPFEETHGALMARWAEVDRPLHASAAEGFTLDVGCNWKLAVENYCESYHLPWVHPGLNSYSRLEDHYHIQDEAGGVSGQFSGQFAGRFSGQGTLVYRPLLAEDGRRFPDFEGLSRQWDEGAEYVALYPNVLLGVHRDHAFAIVLAPQGPGRTLEHVRISYTDAGVLGPEWEAMRARNTRMWREVFEEDVFVVEGMQRGRQARGFDGGRFSPAMDGPTHAFHAWVAGRLREAAP